MKKLNITIILKMACLICFVSFNFSCSKQDDFLNVKAIKSDVTPSTIQDFQAVLDNTTVMNSHGSILGLVGTDNIFISDANLAASDQTSRNAYLWQKDIYQGGIATDWYNNYQVIEYANIVLDGLAKINDHSNASQFNDVRGGALFFRSFAFYQLSQLYCKSYAKTTASTDLGIPLRLSSDVNLKSKRATVQDTYNQIINDLNIAVSLLSTSPLYKTRPSSVAATALLSKVYLDMGDYQNAWNLADKSLKSNNILLDYNTLSNSVSNPFPTIAKGHPEIIFFAATYGLTTVISQSSVKARVNPDLYASYEVGDLRRTAFYSADGTTGYYKFKGSYTAQPYNFCGIANDEIYLIRAECSARLGKLNDALADLNTLLKKRYSSTAFKEYHTDDQATLLKRIILERRKEMPYTGNIRWEDLKRLNLEPDNSAIITRTNHNTTYTLVPNDPRYVYPLPDDEIKIDGLPQNNR